LIVGLLSWATESVLFTMVTARGVQVSQVMLSRPYFFLFWPIVTSSWSFLLVCLIVVVGVSMIKLVLRRRNRVQSNRNGTQIQLDRFESRVHLRVPGSPRLESAPEMAWLERPSHTIQQKSLEIKLLSYTTLIFLPLAFVSSMWSVSFVTKIEVLRNVNREALLFFLPNSNNSILNLDQALAFAAGMIAFVYSAWNAYRSRKSKDSSVDPVMQRRGSI